MIPHAVQPPAAPAPPKPPAPPKAPAPKKSSLWCRRCGATATGRWRTGPQTWAQPRKSLCNRCGLRFSKGTDALPPIEPTTPIAPAENSMFNYLRMTGGHDQASIHSKLKHMAQLRNKVYGPQYKRDIFKENIDRTEIERFLAIEKSQRVTEVQGQIVAMFPNFEGRNIAHWIALEDLIKERQLEMEKTTFQQKELLDQLCKWRKKLTCVHRETLQTSRDLEADNVTIKSPPVQVSAPSAADKDTPMLAEAAAATLQTETQIHRMSKNIERELNALFNAFITMKRELPYKLNGDIRLCKELRDLIRRKLEDVRKWTILPDFGSGTAPEQRIYDKYVPDRFEGVNCPIYSNYGEIRNWFLTNGAEVVIKAKKYNLLLFKDDIADIDKQVKWLQSPVVHTFFPRPIMVAAIRDTAMILIPSEQLVKPTMSTIQPSDYIRQLIQVLLICESSAAPEGWEGDSPRILPLESYQIFVTTQGYLKIWPHTNPLDKNYYPPEASDKRHRNHNWNLGVLLYEYFFHSFPPIDLLTKKVKLPWPRSTTDLQIVRYLPLLRCLLNDKRSMSLSKLQYVPLVICSSSNVSVSDSFGRQDREHHMLSNAYTTFTDRQRMDVNFMISVSRETIVTDMLNALSGLDVTGKLFYRHLEFKFTGEDGIGEGVTQSVYQTFATELLKHCIFKTIGGSYMPFVMTHPDAMECEECGGKCKFLTTNPIEYYSALGTFFSIIFTRKINIRMPMSRLLVHYLIGNSSYLKLLKASADYDPEVMKTFARYRSVDDISEYELTWGNLKPDQSNIVITNESLDEFLKIKLKDDLFGTREPWLMTMKESFLRHKFMDRMRFLDPDIVHHEMFGLSIPTAAEIFRAIMWAPMPDTPDTLDLRQAFTAMIHEFTETERAKFVEWITGAEVISEDPNFRISVKIMRNTHGGWPIAQTCFRKVNVPLYDFFIAHNGQVDHEENRKKLHERFTQAWEMGSTFLNR